MSASSRDCLLCFTSTTHSSFAKIVFTSEKIEVEISNSAVLVYISTDVVTPDVRSPRFPPATHIDHRHHLPVILPLELYPFGFISTKTELN
jgi:hypothetical protein